MKRNRENLCRCCRRVRPDYQLKTLRGKIISVCKRCQRELIELQMFLAGIRNILMPPDETIRFFRIPFVPQKDLPQLDLKTLRHSRIVDPHTLHKFPQAAFGKPDIAVLHKTAMRITMAADKKNALSISRKAIIPKYAVDQFLDLQIADPKSNEFHGFLRWIIDHGYTLNQIIHRPDVRTLFQEASSGS